MKTNLDKHFKTDDNLVENGIEMEYGEAVFTVRPFTNSNPRLKAAMVKYYKPLARQIEAGTLDRAKGDEATMKAFIDVCLVKWVGLKDGDKEIEFTKENALELFKSLPALFEELFKQAQDNSNYKEEVGNS